MLPKKNRLSKTADVNLTTAKGRTFFSQSFLIKFLNRPESDHPQITVIASVKVSKSAVVRNRLKRIVRQVLQDHINNIKPGYYVFVLKHSAASIETENLHKEVLDGLKKAKQFKMKQLLIIIIKAYQKTLSPDHGLMKFKFPHGFCRFYPSCSEYAIEVIEHHGVIKGIALSGIRIIKCNPFTTPKINKPI